ncbi:MAG: glycosyltransferase family 4 protein [Rickettsiales bacterium]|nr:MAG: glycosyltransferase family 4 protein [Rickettsiales bacterium]
MKYIIIFIIIGLISLISSLVLTKILIKFLKNYGIVDIPCNRRSHVTTTPRGGGLVLVVIMMILFPISEYYMLGDFKNSNILLHVFLPISLISFWDDISHIAVPVRLLVHVICSALAIMWWIHPYSVFHSQIPLYIDFLIALLCLLGWLNIYNFMDGIDGITASETIHLSITILAICFLNYDIILNVDIIIIITTIILGWTAGFICFNWHPAKIFVGDVGSISIGFLLGICLISIAASSITLFVSCVIASLYYIADGGLTILIRLFKGEKIWQPHLQHFFQKALKKGLSHSQVVKRIIICNFFLMLLSVYSLYYPIISITLAILVVSITLIRSII